MTPALSQAICCCSAVVCPAHPGDVGQLYQRIETLACSQVLTCELWQASKLGPQALMAASSSAARFCTTKGACCLTDQILRLTWHRPFTSLHGALSLVRAAWSSLPAADPGVSCGDIAPPGSQVCLCLSWHRVPSCGQGPQQLCSYVIPDEGCAKYECHVHDLPCLPALSPAGGCADLFGHVLEALSSLQGQTASGPWAAL